MEPIYHFLIPLVILLILVKDKKLVLLLAPISIIPDFDVLLPNSHRALFHSIFFGIFLMTVAYFIVKKSYKVKLNQFIFISSFLFLGHLLLDFDNAGVAFFFPFEKYAYALTSSGVNKIPLSELYISIKNVFSLNASLYLQFVIIAIIYIFFLNYVFPFKRIYYRIRHHYHSSTKSRQ